MDERTVNAVFEGGGVRGVALAGAAAAALDHGYRFDHSVGTSAGSLVASLVAAGYDPDELSSIVCSVDWPGLLDPSPGLGIPLIGRHIALVLHRGLYRGEKLERVWGELLEAKGVRTFRDLRPGSLTVVATDLSHAKGVELPDGLARYGLDPQGFSIARAVRMSSSVPFLFRPVPLFDRRIREKVLMADGAMAANYPVGLARRDRPVIGFRLDAHDSGHPHERVAGPASLARSVMIAGIRARYTLPRVHEAGAHVISVPVSADLDFDMSPDGARAVFDRGREAASEQLAALDLGSESLA
ncbi:MAG: patatin-like phospholipase family protein [Acidimicrobiia bacterium]